MSLNFINRCLLSKSFWVVATIFLIAIYIYPLLSGYLYVPVYDNLDSNVVWYKILADSGKVFSLNNTIIPNMMNGIPRVSYSSEFDILLWLYYFFEPKTAFIINEVMIHLIALIGSYLLLKKYIVSPNRVYANALIYIGTIYFTTLPFWSGSGASIASLPLTTYILLDIHNRQDTKWHWLYLIILPLYSSFILVYMFYIVYAGIYWLYCVFKDKSVDKRLLYAIILLGILFLLKNYRLLYSMFIDSSFTSHRVEFDVFFNVPLFESYRLMLVKFLQGHIPHAEGLQQLYLIPISLIALLLAFSHRRFTAKESMLIWTIILLSFATDTWYTLLVNRYAIPIIILLSLILIKINKRYKHIALVLLIIISIDFIASMFQYEGLKWITTYFPILKSLNIVRLYFIEILFLPILLVLSLRVFFQKLHYTPLFALIFIITQFFFAKEQSFYQTKQKLNYLTFNQYYAPNIFQKLKKDIEIHYPHLSDLTKTKFISYGIEPAVPLYNGLYTVDGYSTNYPLAYKYKFRKTQNKVLDLPISKGNRELYDHWGSKVYLIGLDSRVEHYKYFTKTKVPPVFLNADINAICNLGTDFIITSHPLKGIKNKPLILFKQYKGEFWRIWIYRLNCNIKGRF